jgi:hypothetical protein
MNIAKQNLEVLGEPAFCYGVARDSHVSEHAITNLPRL